MELVFAVVLLPAIVPLCGLVILIIADVLYVYLSRRDRPLRVLATIAWTVPALVALGAVAVLASRGWCQSAGMAKPVILIAVIVCSGLAILPRERVISALEGAFGRRAVPLAYLRDLVMLAIVVVAAFLSIEWSWNDWLPFFERWKILLNGVPIAVVLVALYLIGQRRGAPLAVGSVAALIIGLAQYFVLLCKGASIKPSDLFALNTALTVVGGYEFVIQTRQLFCIAMTCCVVALLAYMRPPAARRAEGEARRWTSVAAPVVARTGTGVALLAALFVTLVQVNFCDAFGLERGYSDSRAVYTDQGFTASFISLAQNSIIRPPEGYTPEGAEDLLEAYAQDYLDDRGSTPERAAAEGQFAEQRPTVIAIMNESFSDLSIYDGLRAGYDGPSYATGIPDALYKGYTYVSVFGGNTCNSEYEFLTGSALAFVGAENQPYITHQLTGIDTLPRLLGEAGYRATAMHPMPAQNWNRKVAYPAMGFGAFLDQTAFAEDAPVRHSGMTDAVTYAEILELVEQEDAPQFIFDVTMQNHGGYGTWDLPESERVALDLGWMDEELAIETTEYVSLMEASDNDIEAFIDELRDIDEPVVVVFFGDHQPSMDYNSAIFGDEDPEDPVHFQRSYCTPYFIWANYDVAGNDQVSERLDIGLFSLQALLLDSIGAPLTQQQMATLSFMEQVPILNAFGYQTADGTWHVLGDDSEWDQAVRDLAWIQYLEFGSRM